MTYAIFKTHFSRNRRKTPDLHREVRRLQVQEHDDPQVRKQQIGKLALIKLYPNLKGPESHWTRVEAYKLYMKCQETTIWICLTTTPNPIINLTRPNLQMLRVDLDK